MPRREEVEEIETEEEIRSMVTARGEPCPASLDVGVRRPVFRALTGYIWFCLNLNRIRVGCTAILGRKSVWPDLLHARESKSSNKISLVAAQPRHAALHIRESRQRGGGAVLSYENIQNQSHAACWFSRTGGFACLPVGGRANPWVHELGGHSDQATTVAVGFPRRARV